MWGLLVDGGAMLQVHDAQVAHSLVIGLWTQAMMVLPLEQVSVLVEQVSI